MQKNYKRLARVDTSNRTGQPRRNHHLCRSAALRNQRLPASHLLLYCDVDRFKAINDTFGTPSATSCSLPWQPASVTALRDGDTVGRTGGDEMLVILPTMHNINEVTNIAERIRRHVAEPIQHLDQTIHTTAQHRRHLARPGESVPELTTRADTASGKAKKPGATKSYHNLRLQPTERRRQHVVSDVENRDTSLWSTPTPVIFFRGKWR